MAGMGFEGAGGVAGGYDALARILAERIAAKKYQDLLAQRAVENAARERQLGQSDRRMNIDESQFGQTMGMRGKEFEEGQRQFNEMAPTREAGRLHTVAQTTELQRRPQAEAEARGHAAEMADLNAGYREEEAGRQHGYRLGEIRESGAQRLGEIQESGLQNRLTQREKPPTGGRSGAATTMQKAAQYTKERTRRALESVDSLLPKVGYSNTGLMGPTRILPGTPARNLAEELKTLGSALSVKELNEMREASRTGGSLGNISDREIDLLQNAMGAISQDQSPPNLKRQLKKIRTALTNMQKAAEEDERNPNLGMNQPSGPEVGTMRIINGIQAVWDGEGWLPATDWTGGLPEEQ